MSDEIQTMTLEEFRDLGYLQELNRRFLHPLGLAIGLMGDFDEDGNFEPSGEIQIQDYRDDPEGMRFSEEEMDLEFYIKSERIKFERQEKFEQRLEELGYVIQPVEVENE